jgi:hypothetical protein
MLLSEAFGQTVKCFILSDTAMLMLEGEKWLCEQTFESDVYKGMTSVSSTYFWSKPGQFWKYWDSVGEINILKEIL